MSAPIDRASRRRLRGGKVRRPPHKQLSSYVRDLIEKSRLGGQLSLRPSCYWSVGNQAQSRKNPTSGVPKAGPKRGGDAPRNHAIRMFATAVLPVRRSS